MIVKSTKPRREITRKRISHNDKIINVNFDLWQVKSDVNFIDLFQRKLIIKSKIVDTNEIFPHIIICNVR